MVGNGLQPTDVACLVEALRVNKGLRHLNLQGKSVDKALAPVDVSIEGKQGATWGIEQNADSLSSSRRNIPESF